MGCGRDEPDGGWPLGLVPVYLRFEFADCIRPPGPNSGADQSALFCRADGAGVSLLRLGGERLVGAGAGIRTAWLVGGAAVLCALRIRAGLQLLSCGGSGSFCAAGLLG